jgi:hypothetical protein
MKADLIKEINSKNLDPQIKEKALAAIERIAKNNESDYDSDKTVIGAAFTWCDTEEGEKFWRKIHKAPESFPSPLISSSSPKIEEEGAKHTPGQLRTAGFLIGNWQGDGAESRGIVASVGQDVNLSKEEHLANAAFMVEAWNSHDALTSEISLLKEQVRVMGEAVKSAIPLLERYRTDAISNLSEPEIGHCMNCYPDIAPDEMCNFHGIESKCTAALKAINVALSSGQAGGREVNAEEGGRQR